MHQLLRLSVAILKVWDKCTFYVVMNAAVDYNMYVNRTNI